MTVLGICFIILVFVVWRMSERVSRLEKHLDEIRKSGMVKETPALENKPEEKKDIPEKDALAAMKVPQETVKQTLPAAEIPEQALREKEEAVKKPVINWELFAGVKLFAWIGGFAAFLGIIFFTKYTIDNNLLGPELRAGIGFAAGIALVCAGIFTKSEKLKTTANVLSAVGIVFIYVCAYASGNICHILNNAAAFTIMIAASVAAFTVSLWKNAKYISVLAAVCGYLTPVLLSAGGGAVISLSVYMAILTVTIMLISIKKEWGFLVWLSAAGVYMILFTLCAKHYVFYKPFEMSAIFEGFCVLFTAFALLVVKKYKFAKPAYKLAPTLFNIFSLFFVFTFFKDGVLFNYSYFGVQLLLIINGCMLLVALNDKYFKPGFIFSSNFALLALFIWTCAFLNQKSLWFALGAYFIFFLFNALFPVLDAYKKKTAPSQWHVFIPALMILMFSVTIGKVYFVYLSVWMLIAVIACFALSFSELFKNFFTGLLTLFGIFLSVFVWMLSTKSFVFDITSFTGILTGFAVGIFVLALVLKKHSLKILSGFGAGPAQDPSRHLYPAYNIFLVSVFFLLSAAIIKVKPEFPDVFIVSGIIVSALILFLSLINETKNMIGLLTALVSMFFMELIWQSFYFTPESYDMAVLWYFIVFLFFFGSIFLMRKYCSHLKMPWFIAAAAGVLQCFLIYMISRDMPWISSYAGLVPAFFAFIYAGATYYILRKEKTDDEFRKAKVGIFVGTTLLFITMIFPAQFKTQWLTISWALEAALLIGLFKFIPYRPLKYWGFWIFVLIFIGNVIPDAYLFTVTAGSIANWYLYVYSITVAAMFAGAYFWEPKGEKYAGINNRNAIFTFALILLFMLLNTEIAAFFATGDFIRFSFNNSFAQDMAYTLCWGIFSITLFIFGIIKKIKAVRIAGLALLSVTTLKLFLHDLWNLGQLYRIGSLFGLAVMLILFSFLYQKYVVKTEK